MHKWGRRKYARPTYAQTIPGTRLHRVKRLQPPKSDPLVTTRPTSIHRRDTPTPVIQPCLPRSPPRPASRQPGSERPPPPTSIPHTSFLGEQRPPGEIAHPVNTASRVEKYRPVFLDDVVGNTETIERLKIISREGNMPHVIISGMPGIGKTTSIHCLARQLLGDAYKEAVLELNASDERGAFT
ncbi:hypothetical protein IMZ48_43265 [Candidatus Bathyarchaeota archaeon]|nr:hypothetical protein [Candidatus Bathyarchaeota archaeon]